MGRKTTQAPARIFIRPEVELTCRHCKHYDNDDCPTIRGKFVPFPAYPCDEFDRNDYPLYGDWNDKKFLLEHVEYRAVVPVPADVQEASRAYADRRLLENDRKLAESGHTRHRKMGQVCFAGYEIEEAFADGMLAERERLASLPTIKGWVARNKDGDINCYPYFQPDRLDEHRWVSDPNQFNLDHKKFPSLRWEDEPREVEIIIKEVKK